jgi:hypothetical protein
MTTFTNDENRARLKDAIEKPITHIDNSAGTEPARSLGTPMLRVPSTPNGIVKRPGITPSIPNGVVQGPAITPTLRTDLSKFSNDKRGRIFDVVAGK